MIDEVEFREILNSLNLVFCPFSKAILNNHCRCEHSHRHLLAGREIAGCKYEAAQRDCKQLLGGFRKAATFTLKIRDTGSLPHGKAIRVQVGGLKGLQYALHPELKKDAAVENIYGLILETRDRFSALDQLPDQEIIQAIAEFRGRRARKS